MKGRRSRRWRYDKMSEIWIKLLLFIVVVVFIHNLIFCQMKENQIKNFIYKTRISSTLFQHTQK